MRGQIGSCLSRFSLLPAPRLAMYWAHLDCFPKYIIERPSDESKSLDKVPVMAHESAKCVDLGKGLWHRELLHRVDIVSAGVDPLTGNMMHKVYNL